MICRGIICLSCGAGGLIPYIAFLSYTAAGVNPKIAEDIVRTDSRAWALAGLISDLLSPPVVWGVLAFPIAFSQAESADQAILWAAIYVALVCLAPVLYIVWMVRTGRITDLHMRVRSQRLKPFIVSMAFTTLAWWVLRALGAPPVLPKLALYGLIETLLLALVSLVWQISVHGASIAGAVLVIGLLFGSVYGLILLPLVGVVAWARLYLKRHTPPQIVAGGLLGAALAWVIFCAL